jgi:DNA-binding transcriptional regulator YdaS (Cro superfamily)
VVKCEKGGIMHQLNLIKAEFGSITKLAEQLEIRPSAVYNWADRGQVPIKHLKRILELSEGRLTKEIMRPDLFKD